MIISNEFLTHVTAGIALEGLADGSTKVSSTIDNTVLGAVSADIQLKFKTGTGTSSDGVLTLLIMRSIDGVVFDDALFTSEILGTYLANVDSTNYVVSATSTQIGTLPNFYRIAIKNESGSTLDSNAGNFSVKLVNVTSQNV